MLNTESGRKWAKAGIELTHWKPHLSVVVKDRWADWSLLPAEEGGDGGGGGGVTIGMVREDDGSVWVYSVQRCERVPVREVTWGFEGVKEEKEECWVGVYAARPGTVGGDLVVDFDHLVVE